MSNDRDTEAPHTPGKPLPCRICKTLTAGATLAVYGAQCFRCYAAYCREPQPKSAFLADKRRDPKAWARALKAREERGEHLTLAQRDMWREALKSELAQHQHVDEGGAS